MSVELNRLETETRKYMQHHFIPEIIEALISALLVHCPHNPYIFMLQCLENFQANNAGPITWSMFISDSYRKSEDLRYFTAHWKLTDKFWDASNESLNKALDFYKYQLTKKKFDTWLRYHRMIKIQLMSVLHKIRIAETYYQFKIYHFCYTLWKAFYRRRTILYENVSVLLISAYRSYLKTYYWNHFKTSCKLLDWEDSQIKESVILYTKSIKREISFSLQKLPERALQLIFKNLHVRDRLSCALVCQEWCDIATSRHAWNYIDCHVNYGMKVRISTSLVNSIFNKYALHTKYLNLSGCSYLPDDTYSLLSSCHHLLYLNISRNQRITDLIFKSFIEGVRTLKCINISYTNVGDLTLRMIACFCMDLKILEMAGCKKVSDRGLVFFTRGETADWLPKKVEILDLSENPQLNIGARNKMMEACPYLKKILLDDMRTLTDRSLSQLNLYAPNLKYLSARGMNLVGGDGFFSLLTTSVNLKSLFIENNHAFRSKFFQKWPGNLRILSLAYCFKVKDPVLKGISYLNYLIDLRLSGLTNLTDLGLKYICLSRCTKTLISLDISYCIGLTDAVFILICYNIINLQNFNCRGCELFTDNGFKQLQNLVKLKNLDVSECTITDDALIKLYYLSSVSMASCRFCTLLGYKAFLKNQKSSLQYIDVSENSSLSDKIVNLIALSCPYLLRLNIRNCSLLTDDSLRYLASFCPLLKRLQMQGCSLISNNGLLFLCKHCKHLEYLDVSDCKQLSLNTLLNILTHGRIIESSLFLDNDYHSKMIKVKQLCDIDILNEENFPQIYPEQN